MRMKRENAINVSAYVNGLLRPHFPKKTKAKK